MQVIEAALSFLVFSSILAAALAHSGESRGPDDSLYRMQLANDAWRVLYLRGDFEGLESMQGGALSQDMGEITRQTSLCVFLDGIRSTSCRGGDADHAISVTASRTLMLRGGPVRVSFSLGD